MSRIFVFNTKMVSDSMWDRLLSFPFSYKKGWIKGTVIKDVVSVPLLGLYKLIMDQNPQGILDFVN